MGKPHSGGHIHVFMSYRDSSVGRWSCTCSVEGGRSRFVFYIRMHTVYMGANQSSDYEGLAGRYQVTEPVATYLLLIGRSTYMYSDITRGGDGKIESRGLGAKVCKNCRACMATTVCIYPQINTKKKLAPGKRNIYQSCFFFADPHDRGN